MRGHMDVKFACDILRVFMNNWNENEIKITYNNCFSKLDWIKIKKTKKF